MKKSKFIKLLAAVTATLVMGVSIPFSAFATSTPTPPLPPTPPTPSGTIHVMQVPDGVGSVTVFYDGSGKSFPVSGTTGESPKFDGTYPAGCTDKNINSITLNWTNGATTSLNGPDLKISAQGQGTINITINKKDLKMPLAVTVNYYKGSVTNPSDAAHFVTSTIYQRPGLKIGDKIELKKGDDPNELSYQLPLGYFEGVQQGTKPYVVVAGTNVINVLFTPCSHKVTVNYYKDSMTNPQDKDTFLDSITLDAVTDEDITLGIGLLNAFKPDATYQDGAQQKPVPFVVKADEKSHVINVLYLKKELTVTVNYYKGSVSEANKLGTGNLATTYHVGDTITLAAGSSANQLDFKKPAAGYASGKQQGTVPYAVVDGSNVINVVYSAVLADQTPPLAGPKTGDNVDAAAIAIGLLSLIALGSTAVVVKKRIGR